MQLCSVLFDLRVSQSGCFDLHWANSSVALVKIFEESELDIGRVFNNSLASVDSIFIGCREIGLGD